MEVASAGDRGADWVKLGLELADHLPADRCWWEPLFAGYGSEPPFDTLRLRLLAAGWVSPRADFLERVLEAQDWHALFLNPRSTRARS